ncbi:hypothetical protein CSUI_004680, partial [Cystoisospora suis]
AGSLRCLIKRRISLTAVGVLLPSYQRCRKKKKCGQAEVLRRSASPLPVAIFKNLTKKCTEG